MQNLTGKKSQSNQSKNHDRWRIDNGCVTYFLKKNYNNNNFFIKNKLVCFVKSTLQNTLFLHFSSKKFGQFKKK